MDITPDDLLKLDISFQLSISEKINKIKKSQNSLKGIIEEMKNDVENKKVLSPFEEMKEHIKKVNAIYNSVKNQK